MKKSTKHLPRESLGDSYNSVGYKLLDAKDIWDQMFDFKIFNVKDV